MTVKRGFQYCGEHLPNDPQSECAEDSKTLRIICPLDNKHTCFAHKLQKHLKICNAQPNTNLPYISKGVNCGQVDPDSTLTLQNTRQLSSVQPGAIKDLVQKITKIYDEAINGKILTNVQKHEILEVELKKPEFGDRTKKHLIQASSIVGILRQKDLIKDETCYIEFGAGKGQLSYWIAQAVADTKSSSVLLVERASHRHKFDNKLDKSEGRVHRVKADIGDLMLNKVEAAEKCAGVVGLTKHLCGDATDLTLRCLQTYESNGGKVFGVIMAFCCHHRCQWTAYTGKDFFAKHGLTRDEFDIMCGMVSWAVCGSGLSRESNKDSKEIPVNERDKEIGLSREEKEEVGRRCKNILDYGRMHFMESLGFGCEMFYYVDASVSPENVCIVAVK